MNERQTMDRSEVTPEQGVHDGATTKVVGRRVAAALIDIALMFGLFMAMALTVGTVTTAQGSFSAHLEGIPALLYFGLVLSYFFAFEATSGQTVGKRLMKLRVVRLDGTLAGPGAITIRTLLRLVDFLPFLNLVGFVCILVTRRRQRIGDLLAKTIVVRL